MAFKYNRYSNYTIVSNDWTGLHERVEESLSWEQIKEIIENDTGTGGVYRVVTPNSVTEYVKKDDGTITSFGTVFSDDD